eukprot:c18822_g2_i1 orf=83-289(+)
MYKIAFPWLNYVGNMSDYHAHMGIKGDAHMGIKGEPLHSTSPHYSEEKKYKATCAMKTKIISFSWKLN